jgi:hypothetical protein
MNKNLNFKVVAYLVQCAPHRSREPALHPGLQKKDKFSVEKVINNPSHLLLQYHPTVILFQTNKYNLLPLRIAGFPQRKADVPATTASLVLSGSREREPGFSNICTLHIHMSTSILRSSAAEIMPMVCPGTVSSCR